MALNNDSVDQLRFTRSKCKTLANNLAANRCLEDTHTGPWPHVDLSCQLDIPTTFWTLTCFSSALRVLG